MDRSSESTTRDSPSLISLCERVIGDAIGRGFLGLEEICELPYHLMDSLLGSLDPLGLESLQPRAFEEFQNNKCRLSRYANGAKRGRFVNLSGYWKVLFISRWPASKSKENVCEICTGLDCFTDWQQLYWEMHLQGCLDEASEIASLPGFNGYLGEISLSDSVVNLISNNKDDTMKKGIWNVDFSRLAHHCQRFGYYVRQLRVRNVLCMTEMWDLLGSSNLKHVVFCNIKSEIHVNGACNLLSRNQESLLSIEFLRCTFLPTIISKISDFTGKSLFSLKFCESTLAFGHAKSFLTSLLYLPSCLSVVEISDSDIKSWQYNDYFRYRSVFATCSGSKASFGLLGSISVLNLRGNELDKNDAHDLRNSLVYMKSLRCLNLSDNPLTDDGIRILASCFIEAMEKAPPLVELKLDNCNLSSVGANELLTNLIKSNQSLKSLSIACNELGRSTAGMLARVLEHSNLQTLNIEDIGLSSLGFEDLQSQLPKDIRLLDLNISKNRGRIGAARCISKVMFHAPELAAITACHNLMPPESVEIIYNVLEHSKGKLRKLDLTGNWQLHQSTQASKLAEFVCQGEPIVILPPVEPHAIPYDDDP